MQRTACRTHKQRRGWPLFFATTSPLFGTEKMSSSPPEKIALGVFVAVCDGFLTRVSPSTVRVAPHKGTTRASSAKYLTYAKKELGKQRPGGGGEGGGGCSSTYTKPRGDILGPALTRSAPPRQLETKGTLVRRYQRGADFFFFRRYILLGV